MATILDIYGVCYTKLWVTVPRPEALDIQAFQGFPFFVLLLRFLLFIIVFAVKTDYVSQNFVNDFALHCEFGY